ncbi:MAG: YeeE/YedE family protein [Chloroflexi bacterium]|nr:YeeE/YedE family protein [Chloroflexota bacterium]
MTLAAAATLLGGMLLGYLGQRSRMCFVGAIRDWLLVRDASLLKGLVAFGLTAWLAYPVLSLLVGEGEGLPFLSLGDLAWGTALVAVIAGMGLGVVSTLANGCPFRQHVRAGQGSTSSLAYLLGFYLGALAFYLLLYPVLARLL